MAIKFSQFNLRTDHTSGMYLVGYDGNQNIHITVDNLFDDFINGTENTIAMFGTGGTVLADSILSQNAGATALTVAGQLNVDAAATFDTNITVEGNSTLKGNVGLGDADTDLIIQTGTLHLNGPVKDVTDTLGTTDQVLLSNASGKLTFTYLSDLHVGGAEVVEVPVKNVQGSALVKGDPVYISGSVGASGRLEVQLADASNTLKMPAVGLLKQDLANNAEGFAVVTGKLRNLITDPIDGVNPTENDVIYVKPSGTSGAALTTTKPVYGNFIQNIGKVGRVSTSNDGNFVVSSILRTNDIPNLTPGRLWVGSTGNTIESQTLFVDEATGEVGIGTTDPYTELHIKNTVDNPGLMIESEEATGGIYQNSYINLRARESSTNTLANGVISIHGVNSTSDAGAKTLRIRNQTLGGADVLISTLDSSNAAKNPARFKSSGQVQFEEYGSGSFTGTIAKNLSIDSSGNIIETNPAVDGSGTLNYVTKWTPDGNSLGDSIIFDNGSQVAIGTTSPAASVKLHVEGAIRVNGGNLNVTNTSLPIIYLNTSSSTDNYSIRNSSGNFQVKNQAGLGQIQFQILNSGQAKLDLYGQGTFSGTATKTLAVDANGSIIETAGVSVDGSGTANYVTKWLDTDTITDSVIYDNGTNVGIGTASPGQKLDVNGSIQLAQYGYIYFGSNSSNQLRFSNSLSGAQITQTGSGNLELKSGSNDIHLKAGGLTKAVVRATGNVGIGTTSPDYTLDVAGNAGFDEYLYHNGDSDTNIRFLNNNIYLNAGGGGGLQCSNSTTALQAFHEFYSNSDFKIGDHIGINSGMSLQLGGLGSDLTFESSAGYKAIFSNSSTTYFQTNVGIGTTNPSQKLHVNGSGIISSHLAIGSTNITGTPLRVVNSNAGTTGAIFESTNMMFTGTALEVHSTSNSNVQLMKLRSVNTDRFIVGGAGQIGVGGANYGTSGQVLTSNGSGSAPSWQNASGSSNWTTSGNNIYNNNSGNVGIGTSNPSQKLDVSGSIRLGQYDRIEWGSNNSATLRIQKALSGATFTHTGSGNIEINPTIAGITFKASGTAAATLTSSGNFGIGTTSPATKLDVNGGIRMANSTLTAASSNVGTLRYRTSGNNSYVDMSMQTGPSTYEWVNIVQNNW